SGRADRAPGRRVPHLLSKITGLRDVPRSRRLLFRLLCRRGAFDQRFGLLDEALGVFVADPVGMFHLLPRAIQERAGCIGLQMEMCHRLKGQSPWVTASLRIPSVCQTLSITQGGNRFLIFSGAILGRAPSVQVVFMTGHKAAGELKATE